MRGGTEERGGIVEEDCHSWEKFSHALVRMREERRTTLPSENKANQSRN